MLKIKRNTFLIYLTLATAFFALKSFEYFDSGATFLVDEIYDSGPIRETIKIPLYNTDVILDAKNPRIEILGGAIDSVQNMNPFDFILLSGLLYFFFFLGVGIISSKGTGKYNIRLVAAGIILSIIFVFLSLRFSQGWDELYLNLKHSYNLMHHDIYSLHSNTLTEATVDFLPFFTIGLLGKLNLFSLETLAVGLSLLGGIYCIFLIYFLVFKHTYDRIFSLLVAAGATCFAPLVYVSATGFMASVFAAVILSSYCLLFYLGPKARLIGYFLLGILTLFRTEGILLAFLLWCSNFFPHRRFKVILKKTKAKKIVLVTGVILAAPFIISYLVRFIVFSEPIPLPIVFKSTGLNLTYLKHGIFALLSSFQGFGFDILFLTIGIFIFSSRYFTTGRRRFVVALTIFCVFYSIGGPDWFPLYWGRYVLPLALFLYIFFSIVCFRVFTNLSFGRKAVLFAALLPVLVTFAGKRYGYTMLKNVFSPNPAGHFQYQTSNFGLNWQRLELFSAAGELFRMTTPSHAKIGSPEVATVMFKAERDVVDILGVSEPLIARAPFRPINDRSLTDRKSNPKVIKERKPDIIFYFGSVAPYSTQEITTEAFAQHFKMQFDPGKAIIAYYRTGSLLHLLNDYQPIALLNNGLSFFYLVRKEIAATHLALLEELNSQKVGNFEYSYYVPEHFTSRHSDGSDN